MNRPWKQETTASAGDASGGAEHSVVLHYKLSDEEYGTQAEREAIYGLQDRLAKVIEVARAGDFDGNEFGGGKAVLYMYGPDKERLWSVVETEARRFPLRPAFALLRGGPETTPNQVHL